MRGDPGLYEVSNVYQIARTNFDIVATVAQVDTNVVGMKRQITGLQDLGVELLRTRVAIRQKKKLVA